MDKTLNRAKQALLEILGVINHDGSYTDAEFIEQELRAIGVGEDEIKHTEKVSVHD